MLAVGASTALATILPDDRRADWTPGVTVGVPGGIPARTTIYKDIVTDLGADNTGSTDISTILNSAIASCPAGQVIYIPSGTYKVSSRIGDPFKSHYVIRGAGIRKTIIKPAGSSVFNIGNADWPRPSTGVDITAGATKNSTTVTVGATTGFITGSLMRLEPKTNPSYVHPTLGSVAAQTEPRISWIFRVTGKTANTISFVPKLPMDISGFSPRAVPYKQGPVTDVGIEDLSVDALSTSAYDIFYFQQTSGCWLRNVEASNYPARAISWIGASQCEVRQSYFHGGASGSGGEGCDLISDCSFNLIEDNIVYHGGGIFLNDAQHSCGGNVIAYNFAYNHTITSTNLDVAAPDIDLGHGTQDTFNLLEGNIFCSLHGGDGYYGGASHNTIFRNWIKATHPTATKNLNCIFLKHYNVYFNFVGNVLGTPAFPTSGSGGVTNAAYGGWYDAPQLNSYDNGWTSPVQVIYQLGFPNIGNTSYSGTVGPTTPPNYNNEPDWAAQHYDLNVKPTILRHGNYDYFHRDVVWDSSIPDHVIPDSLLYSSKPTWWPADMAWPSIGPDKSPMGGTIPAEMRFIGFSGPPLPPTNLRSN